MGMSGKERANRLASQKSVTARRAIKAGEFLQEADLALLRPGTGIPPRDLRALIGRRAARDIPPGESLRWDMVL